MFGVFAAAMEDRTVRLQEQAWSRGSPRTEQHGRTVNNPSTIAEACGSG